MTKREADLKARFTTALKARYTKFLVLQYSTAGAPDREIVGYGKTSRWEFKHATPFFSSPGLQELTCTRLDAASHCRYVIWLDGPHQRTLIVRPDQIWRRHDGGIEIGNALAPETQTDCDARTLLAESWCVGFDMAWLVDQVTMVHNV